MLDKEVAIGWLIIGLSAYFFYDSGYALLFFIYGMALFSWLGEVIHNLSIQGVLPILNFILIWDLYKKVPSKKG